MAKYINPIQEFGPTISDSYPFVTKDSELWLVLLADAYQEDPELFARLNYLRGAGASLVPIKNPNFKYAIMPIIGDRGWSSMEEWNQEKTCLNDYTDQLVRLLNDLPTM